MSILNPIHNCSRVMQNPLVLHHEKMGAELAHGRVPLWFSNTSDEYLMLGKSAGFADLSHLGVMAVDGKDRLPFLNGLVTNDVGKLYPGSGVHSLLLNTKARVIADLYLYLKDESLLVDTGDVSAQNVKSFLDRFIVTEDVRLSDLTDELVRLTVQGPRATDVIKTVLGVNVQELQPLRHLSIGPSLVVNRDRTGLGGYDLFIPRDEAEPVWQGLLLKAQDIGAGPVGLSALDVYRIERGTPRMGVDVNENTIVLEAGYADAISYSKGCYMGQEVVARATHIGRVNKKLVQLQLETETPALPGSPIVHEDNEVGRITSSAYSPKSRSVVGLGYVTREFAKENARIEVNSAGLIVPARVTKVD
ncbi:MAG: hypothetical protein AUJ07_01120 [Crenarchaeota archaeon 13_1_40CM_3_53_5]|nr:MAG: hypothetical protein AUJ07_01120 [Crenarchaeota archaeon 13_1_40CM_3_53_5]